MANSPSSVHIEIEIHQQLSTNLSLDEVINHLVKNYSDSNLNRPELESLSTFFLLTGYHFTLAQFLVRCLERGLNIPWPHFCEALFKSTPAIPETIKSAIIHGAREQYQLEELARVSYLDHFDDKLPLLRQKRPQFHAESFRLRKEELIATLEMLQAQGLHAEEDRLLEKLNKIFPNSDEAKDFSARKQKKRNIELVQEIKTTRNRWIPIPAFQKVEDETARLLLLIENSMNTALEQFPKSELAHDFAIAHIQWENYSSALKFTDSAIQRNEPGIRGLQWLRLEILFNLRRFIDILTEVTVLEPLWTDDPELTLSLLYMKARCLWELSRKQQAIEIMESICIVRPSFRSARILLAEWRGDAT